MASVAFNNLARRLDDIEQLIKAHTALTQFQRAERAAKQTGRELEKILEVVESLVTAPGRGRRAEVEALNRAAIVLLSAHLQGYIEDLFNESAEILLSNKVRDITALIEQNRSGFSNPHAYRIDRLFASIGMPEITAGLSWRNASNKSIKNRLTRYVELRNGIAHGRQEMIWKAKVLSFKQFVEVFAKHFDQRVSDELHATLKKAPW